jgi:cytochrome c biogenesis protein
MSVATHHKLSAGFPVRDRLRWVLSQLASLRLTLVLIPLAIWALIDRHKVMFLPELATSGAFVLLAVNLAAALVVSPRFRVQPGLMLFHLSLLFVWIIAAAQPLAAFRGRLEIVEGQEFDASKVEFLQRGILRSSPLDEVEFTQGAVHVSYLPSLVRQTSRSNVLIGRSGLQDTPFQLTDQNPLVLNGTRFGITSNKGFAAMIRWRDHRGSRTGAVHFPSFPVFDWKQVQTWTTPNAQEVTLELELLTPPVTSSAWSLNAETSATELVVTHDGESRRLVSGESVDLNGGRLFFEGHRMWIGYTLESNPLLPWLLAAALAGIAGLVWHLAARWSQLPRPGPRKAAW